MFEESLHHADTSCFFHGWGIGKSTKSHPDKALPFHGLLCFIQNLVLQSPKPLCPQPSRRQNPSTHWRHIYFFFSISRLFLRHIMMVVCIVEDSGTSTTNSISNPDILALKVLAKNGHADSRYDKWIVLKNSTDTINEATATKMTVGEIDVQNGMLKAVQARDYL